MFYDWHGRWRTGCISLKKRFENTLLASEQPNHEHNILNINHYLPHLLSLKFLHNHIDLRKQTIGTSVPPVHKDPCCHAQSAMHKPHSFTHRWPLALRNPLAAGVCAKIRVSGQRRTTRVSPRPNHISNIGAACLNWRALGLGPLAQRSLSAARDASAERFGCKSSFFHC